MRSISEHMELEHTHLILQWKNYLGIGNKKLKKQLLKKFIDSLTAHLILEEEKILPILNRYPLIEKAVGSTKLINDEHTEIMKLFGRVQESLQLDEPIKIEYEEKHFLRTLMKHFKKEEDMLYHLFDVVVTEDERKKIWAETKKDLSLNPIK